MPVRIYDGIQRPAAPLKIYGLSIFFKDESDTIHLALDENETRAEKSH